MNLLSIHGAPIWVPRRKMFQKIASLLHAICFPRKGRSRDSDEAALDVDARDANKELLASVTDRQTSRRICEFWKAAPPSRGFHRKYAMRSSVDRLPTIARGMTAVVVTSRGSSVQVNNAGSASDRPKLSLSSTRSARSSDLADFIAYNYARRLKTLKGLTPYEHICKCWTS